jgi:hypothetical protein
VALSDFLSQDEENDVILVQVAGLLHRSAISQFGAIAFVFSRPSLGVIQG